MRHRTRDRGNSKAIQTTSQGAATPNNSLVQFYAFCKGWVTAVVIGHMGALVSWTFRLLQTRAALGSLKCTPLDKVEIVLL